MSTRRRYCAFAMDPMSAEVCEIAGCTFHEPSSMDQVQPFVSEAREAEVLLDEGEHDIEADEVLYKRGKEDRDCQVWQERSHPQEIVIWD